jgi:excinuclease UvrABC helicase subunit UvrB
MTTINLKAYVPRHDLYIEKETEINEEIERLRLAQRRWFHVAT